MLEREILQLISQHGPAAPIDFVAVFMLLNTVAGGHYQDRYSEEQIRSALRALAARGELQATLADGTVVESPDLQPGLERFHITPAGQAALLQ